VERTVVCVARQDGARAQEVAQLAAKSLGSRIIDEDILTRAAAEAGVERDVVADTERRKSRVMSLLEGFATAGFAPGYVPAPNLLNEKEPASDELRGLIRSVIEEVADAGNAVIVSHAASMALGEREDVLRVLVTASPQVRERRLAATLGIDEKEAARAVKRSDAGRADYIKQFYGISTELPTHYDLVINTDQLSPERAAQLIVQAAGGRAEGQAPAA
jgi:cytidylate kinase